ncbi:MAG: VWA domain-containing protein [Acidobacteriota bacterium]|nr:VWA domain-containing protein [Acidobacteriota bacterium]
MKALWAPSVLAGLALVDAQAPVFRSGVEAVRVDVSVMNGTNPVPGLTAANFVLIDRGVPQVVDHVSVDTVPLSLMLVLDTSGSMSGERMTDLIAATRRLVQSLKPVDSTALLTFAEPAELVVPMSRDRAPLLAALDGMKAAGATSLYDGLFLALQMRPEATDDRPVALVFSDGRDNVSWLSKSSVAEAIRRSGVITHIVELEQDQVRGAGVNAVSLILSELAEAGGGRRWSATSSRDLRELFAKVLDELRSRYLLTYYPTGVTREGWHDVKVTLKGAGGDVIARPGYFVATPQ